MARALADAEERHHDDDVARDARVAPRARGLERDLARAQRVEQRAHRRVAARVLEVLHAEPPLEPR